MKHTIILLISVLFSITASADPACRMSPDAVTDDVQWKEIDGISVPVPPAVHPRLYVRSGDIPELKERLKRPEVREIIRKMEKLSEPRTREEEAETKDRGFRYYFAMRGITSEVQLQALDYLRERRLAPVLMTVRLVISMRSP